MPSYTGQNLVLQWVWASGTINMNTDYQTATYTPSVELLDDTAGADTARTYIAGLKNGVLAYTGLMQAGSLPAWGSAFPEGQIGTAYLSPEGTAAGKFKQTIPAICQGMVNNFGYQTQVSTAISWQQNGSRTDGTN